MKAAQETRAIIKLVATPPARIVRLSSSDNSVFEGGGIENNHLRLPDLFMLCGLKQRELCIFRHVVTQSGSSRHILPAQSQKKTQVIA